MPVDPPGQYGPTPYDTVRYPSYTHTRSHVGRLATQAVLYGLDVAPIDRCRVLEIGCGDGTNLVPMAEGLPRSSFVGIDLAADRIDEAGSFARGAGVGNVEFRHLDLQDLDSSWGSFDYVIAHGLYSWVPPDVADALLRACGELLAPNGVAFVSYLTYPGAHARQMLREIMLFHLGELEDPDVIQGEAVELARWLASDVAGEDHFRELLKAEAKRFLTASPAYIFHDDLAEWNVPCYFVQFASAAGRHGLQFLAEADQREMVDYQLEAEAREKLALLGTDRIRRQHYLDFIRARRFRQTLLCRDHLTVADEPIAERVTLLHVSGSGSSSGESIDPSPDVEVSFTFDWGGKLQSRYPLGKAALALLLEESPNRIPYEELEARARERLPAGDESPSAELQQFLVQLYGAGMVDLNAMPARCAPAAGDHPLVSPAVRWQAAHGQLLTSPYHVGYHFSDPWAVGVVASMDGTRDRASLVAELERGRPADAEQTAEAALEQQLEKMAKLGFFPAEPASG